MATASPARRFTPEDFDFGDLLGEGAYAKVCRATLSTTGAAYAIKIVDKHFVTRHNKQACVMVEKQVLSMLNHPNVIRLYWTFQDQDSLYFVLELASGGELYDLIRSFGKLPEPLAAHIAAELADVLSYMHARGIVHRDVKPENILISETGHIKVTDFGTAKISGANSAAAVAPQPAGDDDDIPQKKNSFVGTAEYVAPEVLRNEPAGPAADIWSYGCVLYQMLAGKPPFRGASEYLTFQCILNRKLEFPEHFSAEARDLIDNLLRLEPSERLGARHLATSASSSSSSSSSSSISLSGGADSTSADGAPIGWAAIAAHPFFASTPRGTEALNQTAPPQFSNAASSASASSVESAPVAATPIGGGGGALAAAHAVVQSALAQQKQTEALTAATLQANPSAAAALASAGVGARAAGVTPAVAAAAAAPAPAYSPWRRFLMNGEEVVYTELLEKGRGLFSKRRQLILTTVPRFIYIDVAKMEQKGEIGWSDSLWVELKDSRNFVLHTPAIDRDWYFECLTSEGAGAWVEIINQMRKRPI